MTVDEERGFCKFLVKSPKELAIRLNHNFTTEFDEIT